MLTTIKKLPGVLAFQRGHVLSDALLYSLVNDKQLAIPVVRHGILGTQNVLVKRDQGVAKVSNPQITETARMDPAATALVVRFDIAFLDIKNALFACAGENQEALRGTLTDFLERAEVSEGIDEVARRYARNIANGRWLWRNRSIAESISIKVTNKEGVVLGCFDAKGISLNDFEAYTPAEAVVGAEIARQMRGKSDDRLTVEATLSMRARGNLEVFPSQSYVKKPEGFARPLYKVNLVEIRNGADPLTFKDTQITGYAALRDQKVSNAIRTIDTWYATYDEMGFPIPVEPNGANLGMQVFFRKTGKDTAFDLLKRLCAIDPNSPEGMFFIAILGRGGVFGESEKKDKPDPKAGEVPGGADSTEVEESA